MDSESYGQHIIFITILIFIFFLSYCAIPSTDTLMAEHKISKKTQTKIHFAQKDEEKTVQSQEVKSDTVKAPSKESPEESPEESPAPLQVTKAEEQKVGTTHIDMISMENPLYKVHKKGIVQFTHKTHAEEYLIACGRCHHDEKGQPLDLGADDDAKGCIECHKETEKPKGEKLGKKEKIMKYHFEALHANCIGCHKAYNKEKGDPKGKVPAPASCTNCHPKNK